jgi:hypothetical protein
MDNLIGKKAKNVVSPGFWSYVKFGHGTLGLQRPHGAIGEDDTVPADVATSVGFGEEIIRRGMERHEAEAQLTVFVGRNCRWHADACRQFQRW